MIVSSVIVEDRAQRDGRRAVRERHTDQLGLVYDVAYFAEPGTNASAMLAPRAAQIDADLTASEIAANESRAFDQQPATLSYSTRDQFLARLRQRFQTAISWDAVRLGKYIQSLGLTDAQLKSMFSVNNAQLVTLKAKLASLANKYDDVTAQQGQ